MNIFSLMEVFPQTPLPYLQKLPSSVDFEAPKGNIISVKIEGGNQITVEGNAQDEGEGVVTAVEISWVEEEWHSAKLNWLARNVEFKLVWGNEKWQRVHRKSPWKTLQVKIDSERNQVCRLRLRLTDDSGNSREIVEVVNIQGYSTLEIKEEL